MKPINGLSFVFILSSSVFKIALPQVINSSADTNIIRDQQRNNNLKNIVMPEANVFSDDGVMQKNNPLLLSNIKDHICFPIESVLIEGESHEKFQRLLAIALKKVAYSKGDCIGINGINLIANELQNIVIGKGYTTTRILVSPQDLTSKKLILTVLPGKVRSFIVDQSNPSNYSNRVWVHSNIFPTQPGDILNLRGLEQGLENLERVPTVSATMDIHPADAPNESDIIISWKQRKSPFRLTMSIDDSGSKETGKNQGSFVVSADSLFGYSELFYLSLNKDLGRKKSVYTGFDKSTGGTYGYAAHFSVPYEYWLFAINTSKYSYDQFAAGQNEIYNYHGKSKNSDVTISRILYRDNKRKTSLFLKGWQRESRSFIDDAEIEIQRRKVGGWQLGLEHKEHLGKAILDVNLSYRRGTGAFGSIASPEEDFGEGTSRMKLFILDASLGVPFSIGKQNFYYQGSFHGQWNRTPLTVQDRLSIGGRYTIRGFDGELTLIAERGFYVRNELAWFYKSPANHQVYMALDGGRVSGPSSGLLLGKTLLGGAIGARGQFDVGGVVNYDFFVGTALKKPKEFKTKKAVVGFSVSFTL